MNKSFSEQMAYVAEALELKVKEALQNDVGRGIARIDSAAMEKLGLETGDVIEIESGGKRAAAVLWRGRSEDDGKGVVRLDGILRHNASVSIDDVVKVKKADVKQAKDLQLAPAQEISFEEDFVTYVQERLVNVPLVVGNAVVIDVMGRGIVFTVTQSSPKGIVQVTDATNLKIATKPMKVAAFMGIRYEDIGGLKEEIEEIREMVEIPMKHPEVFKRLGISPPKGVLLFGPPGCGKTLLAKAVASESEAHFVAINGPELMSKFYGQSEENLRKVFDDAKQNAPTIIFMDEIDAIASKREEVSGEVERRVVSQLLTLMDGLEARGDVIVIAATNRPDSIDPALRRPGRFDREVEIRVPDKDGRKEVLQIHTRGMPLAKDVNLDELIDVTYGFTGADMAALAREAAMRSLRRILPEIKKMEEGKLSKEVLDKLIITRGDFVDALKKVEPSAMREVQVEVPKTKWSDVGGLEDTKEELREAVEWPIKYPDTFGRLGITPPRGILLVGPPGCGKTLLARAVATETKANFISIKGPAVLSKWVGESEKAIRELFKRARQVAPSILFFDELDSIAAMRGSGDTSQVSERLVDQLLVELDGLEELHQVVVIGASNRPDLIDSSLLRPGRFDKILFVPLPDKETRRKVFEVHMKKMPLAKDVDVAELVEKTDGFTGADVSAVVKEAGMFAVRENKGAKEVSKKHFDAALAKIQPSMSESEKKEWVEIRKRYVK